MVKASEAFELQVHRIHELLEDSGAQVTWNDHLPDPDNPPQLRQVDITIRRGGHLILIECRHHQTPQDVRWIEELIGRRSSLGADTVIAVSSSSFTQGALKKAKRHGIILRDLCALTDLEITSWGGQVALTLYFYQYSELEVSLCFDRESIERLNVDTVKKELASHPGMQSLFNAAAQQLTSFNLMSGEHAGKSVDFGLHLQLDGFRLSGEPVVDVYFRGRACLISRDVRSPAVFKYGSPEQSAANRDVAVETFELGRTSIVHHGSRLSIFIDLSQLEMPPFCQFRFFRTATRDERHHEAVELTGLDKLWVKGKMSVNIICPN
jgi:hypothetical protein